MMAHSLAIVWIVFLSVGLADEGIRTDRHFVAEGDSCSSVLVERAAHNSDATNAMPKCTTYPP